MDKRKHENKCKQGSEMGHESKRDGNAQKSQSHERDVRKLVRSMEERISFEIKPITPEDYADAHNAWNAGAWKSLHLRASGICDLDYCAIEEMIEYVKTYIPYRTLKIHTHDSHGGGHYSTSEYDKKIEYVIEPPAEKKEIYGRFLKEVINAFGAAHE
ncbi:MAG: hypothetical protein M1331_00385 [Candidatus Marsarchaeota archaeon]|nr:hypothetical protein [Candidatus Marsarchaeota archaeon]